MKKSNLILAVLSLAVLGGCTMKTKILDAGAVSMKHYHLKKGKKLKEIGEVTGEFCTDSSDKGQVGLMDEAIKAAEASSGADFITNVTIYVSGSCVTLEGTGFKVVKR